MDVIIPAHSLKTVSSALTTLSKVGKYLYIEFDPLAGLTFRTLNDGKSSFAQFHFDVGFFERCSSPPGSNLRQRVRATRGDGDNNDDNGDGTSTSGTRNANARGTNGIGRRKRGRGRTQTQTQTQGDDIDDEKYLCRVLIRTVSSILRSRKGLQSLRIRSLGSNIHTNDNANANDNDDNNSDNDNESNSDNDNDDNSNKHDFRMQLSFEFRIQSEGIMRITHKVGVSETESVVAEASRSGCSEIVAEPRVLLKMIDPVKSSEVALIVNDLEKRVTATSFHYADAAVTKNLVLSASAASVLKTETSIDCDEFDDFIFSDGVGEDAPDGVEDEVALVFSTKEAKAMIQFCAQANLDGELRTIVSFHWGGRPIVIETEGENYKAELMLSTVAHGLLNGVDLTSRGQKKNRGTRRNDSTSSFNEARRASTS